MLVDETAAEESPTPRRHGRRSVLFWMSAGWIVAIFVASVFADLLPLPGYGEAVGAPRTPPFEQVGDGMVLGTDAFGRSNLSRVIYGARTSMLIGMVATGLGLLVGGFVGLVSGYLRGWTDRGSSFLVDTLLAFPPLVLLLTITAVLEPSLSTVLLGLSILVVPTFVRLERAAAMAWSERPFVLAARSYGTKDLRIALHPHTSQLGADADHLRPDSDLGAHRRRGVAELSGTGHPFTHAELGRDDRRRQELAADRSERCLRPGGVRLLHGAGLQHHRRTRQSPVRVEVQDLMSTTDHPPLALDRPPLLEVEDLRTGIAVDRGTVRAVDGVSFTLQRGRTLGVVGESGSGKTMLAKSIMGLLPPVT